MRWDPGVEITFKAKSALTSKQAYIVELTAADEVDVCNGAGDLPIGVLHDPSPGAGEACRVALVGGGGIVSVVAGGVITAGDRVGTTAAGKGVTKTADADYIIGVAKTTSAADGDLIEVILGAGMQRAS